ncbi:ferredoxin [Streptomyces sp. NPDC046203]|uniref:ferredoxin n=1 Tax=Streptomyces sp. NPDC046203 TaxID=3154602 RepID=UPI0033F68C8D
MVRGRGDEVAATTNADSGTGTGIRIDTDRCVGAAMCALNAPEVFTQDDDGVSRLLPGGAERARDTAVREAARVCPVQAITLHGT